MASIVEGVVILVIAGLCAAVAGLFALRTFRNRRDRLRGEIDASLGTVEEQAFNRLRIAQAAADRLEKDGVDVHGPRELLRQASAQLDAHHNDDALALASSAYESLLIRAKAPRSIAVPAATLTPAPSSPEPDHPIAMDPLVTGAAGTDAAPVPGRLPRNKAESHFQIRLLNEELANGGPSGTTPTGLDGVRAIAREAQGAYDRGDFTEALRLGLKGRRTLGARLETLPPPTPPAAVPSEPPTESRPAASVPPSACPQCGQPLRSSDQFCRGCGRPVASPTCARCGERWDDGDRFCSRCGAPRG